MKGGLSLSPNKSIETYPVEWFPVDGYHVQSWGDSRHSLTQALSYGVKNMYLPLFDVQSL